MYTPFISIIVPVYKVEFYLRQCIESIINQEGNFELILIEDGSPDKCPEICDEYAQKDNRLKVIHKKNEGVSVARNIGIDIAQGEWIWFVDSDDITNFKFEEINSLMSSLPCNTDYIMFDMISFNDGNTIKLHDNKTNIDSESLLPKNQFLLKYICAYHWCLWYKRSIIQENKLYFSRGLKTGEDGEFQFKYLMLCKHPIKINHTIYFYRKRVGSAMQSPDTRVNIVKDSFIVLQQLLSFMKEHNILEEPWLNRRLQRTLKILLYSATLTDEFDSHYIQNGIRSIVKQYAKGNYRPFNTIALGIAYYSWPLYRFLIERKHK